MPLAPGSDRDTISRNISELTHHGSQPRSHDQIVAIALSNADRHPHRAAGGKMGVPHPHLGGGIGQVARPVSMGQAMPPWTRSESNSLNGIGRPHFEAGGVMSMGQAEPPWTRSESRQISDVPFHSGLIKSAVAGRTDRLPLAVPSESHIIPADAVSGLGQSSTDAGAQNWQASIHQGPWGVAPPKAMRGHGVSLSHAPGLGRSHDSSIIDNSADGGRATTSILAAGGELVVPPEYVEDVGRRGIRDGLGKPGESPLAAGHRLLDVAIANVRKYNIEWLKKAPAPKR